MEKLRLYFKKFGFPDSIVESIVASFNLQEFEKNDMVVTEGMTSRYIGIVESGMFQYYVIKDGQEITSYVSVENTWLASVRSFVSQQPALENIRALTNGKIFMISRTDLAKLVNAVPPFKDFYIGLLEQSIVGIDESRHDLIVLSADQRYAKLLKKEPHLLQQIPLQHLASMLGITPRHLSRIRNSIR
ncbi:MAG: Crp/Fnr family transcriptional regulator [Bacteroidota bacterium]